jgi:hypothetical protein
MEGYTAMFVVVHMERERETNVVLRGKSYLWRSWICIFKDIIWVVFLFLVTDSLDTQCIGSYQDIKNWHHLHFWFFIFFDGSRFKYLYPIGVKWYWMLSLLIYIFFYNTHYSYTWESMNHEFNDLQVSFP